MYTETEIVAAEKLFAAGLNVGQVAAALGITHQAAFELAEYLAFGKE